MFYAKKGNKVLTIDEMNKDRYATEGFTIYKDDKVVQHPKNASVPMAEYMKVVEENEKLKAELEKKPKETEKADKEKEPKK